MLGLTTAAPDGAAVPEHAGDIDPWRMDKRFLYVLSIFFVLFLIFGVVFV